MPLLTELETFFGFVLQRFRAYGADDNENTLAIQLFNLICRQNGGRTSAWQQPHWPAAFWWRHRSPKVRAGRAIIIFAPNGHTIS
jgi:hypothetical protein